ncbi:unnamed protein product, partial [marine sediment metagenome]
MFIDVSKNDLIINASSSKLKPDQINQLKYWGFVKGWKDDIYILNSQSFDSLLLKLLRYFETERIPYGLSQSCQKHVSEQNQKIKDFEAIRILGEEYKEGKFDSVKFSEFVSFVDENIPRKLKKHQLKAAFHLYLIQNGANFSVPGSGKTTAILSVYEKLKSEGKVNLLFVVGPPACFGPWRTEFEETFGRPPDWRILAGGDPATRKSEY